MIGFGCYCFNGQLLQQKLHLFCDCQRTRTFTHSFTQYRDTRVFLTLPQRVLLHQPERETSMSVAFTETPIDEQKTHELDEPKSVQRYLHMQNRELAIADNVLQ